MTRFSVLMLLAIFVTLVLVACDAEPPAQPLAPTSPTPTIAPNRPVATPSPKLTPSPMPDSRPSATPSPEPSPAPVIPARYVITEAALIEAPGVGNDRRARFQLTITNAGGEGGPAPLPVTMAIDDGAPRIIHMIEQPAAGAKHLISPIAEVGAGNHVAVFGLAGEQRRVEFNVPAADLAIALQPLSVTDDGHLLIPVKVTNIGDLQTHSGAVSGAWVPVPRAGRLTERTSRVLGHLEPGESKVLEFKLRPPPGQHNASFFVRTKRDHDADLSNNRIETTFDTQLVLLDVVAVSARQTGAWPEPKLDLVDVSLRIRNRGHAAVTAPVGLMRSAAIDDPAQPAALSRLPRCGDSLATGCWLELSQAQVPAGEEITVWARIALAAGEYQLIGFVGDFAAETTTDLRWDG